MKYPFLSGCTIGALVAMTVFYVLYEPSEVRGAQVKSSKDISESLIFSKNCPFGVARSDGVIQAVNQRTSKPIGYFEKYKNGTVALITPEGFAPDVTKCFQDEHLKKYLPEIPTFGVKH
ncbi:hypothetical protein ACEUAI_20300 [Aeromonas veronii]|nr:hypothetical protein [Aeromonas veronii]